VPRLDHSGTDVPDVESGEVTTGAVEVNANPSTDLDQFSRLEQRHFAALDEGIFTAPTLLAVRFYNLDHLTQAKLVARGQLPVRVIGIDLLLTRLGADGDDSGLHSRL
jgi:hypothetical protein